jgi:hypothetical protein
VSSARHEQKAFNREGREVGAKVAEEILKRRERPLWTQRRAINPQENRVIWDLVIG